MSIGLVTHFYNEEMMLPHWIKHHKNLVDDCILINHSSTDYSTEVIKEHAPKHWRVVNSELAEFDAALTDVEVMEWEKTLKTEWKLTLNITEFIWCKTLPALLREQGKEFDALGLRAYMMVDKNLNAPTDPLWWGRTWGYLDNETSMASRRWRYIHRMEHGNYVLGRHGVKIERQTRSVDWNILFAEFSPWPQAKQRKLQIQDRIPYSDKVAGSGIQHLQNEATLHNFYLSELAKCKNLLTEDSNFRRNYEYYMF